MAIQRNANRSQVNQFGASSLPIRTSSQLQSAANINQQLNDVSKKLTSNKKTQISSDADKYQVAVSQARTELGEGATDKNLRLRTDDIYKNSLGGKTSTADLRGETAATQVIRGLDEGWTDLTNTLGGGVDWLYDNSIGALTGTQDAFSGEDVGGVLDIGADIGLGALSLIPGANAFAIPLLLGKNAIQESNNLYEAASGRDAVSMEQLSDGQRLAKGLGAGLNIGLGSVPVLGKITKPAGAAVKGLVKGTAKEATEQVAKKGAAALPSRLLQGVKNKAGGAGIAAAGLTAGILNRMGETGEDGFTAFENTYESLLQDPVSGAMTLLAPAAGSRLLRKLPSIAGKPLSADRTILTNTGKKAAAKAGIKQSDIVPETGKNFNIPKGDPRYTNASKEISTQSENLSKMMDTLQTMDTNGRKITMVPRQIGQTDLAIPLPGITNGSRLFRTIKDAPLVSANGAKVSNSNMKLMGANAISNFVEREGEQADTSRIRKTPQEIIDRIIAIRSAE